MRENYDIHKHEVALTIPACVYYTTYLIHIDDRWMDGWIDR